MIKKFSLLIVLLIITIAGIILFYLWPKAKLTEIKITGMTLDLIIAQEKGFLREEGFQVKWENISLEDTVSPLLTGKTNYAAFSGLIVKPTVEASLRGAPIKIIIFPIKHQTLFIVGQPGLELNDLKTITILSQYSSEHYHLLKFIKENNLEITIIAFKTWEGNPLQELKNLLLNDEVDAILISPYQAFQLRAQGFSILDAIIDEVPSGLSVRNDKIEKNPEEIQKVIRALEKTAEFIVTNPEETKKLILKIWDLEKTEENLKKIEEYYPLLRDSFDRTDVPYDEGAELLIKLVKAGEFETIQEVEEQIVTREELDKVFDFRFVK